ncbi:MAG: hypothetical protein HKP25_08190 [Marinicaulis sp.]|nr:hypothetical protein [Marinicaulis sp.]
MSEKKRSSVKSVLTASVAAIAALSIVAVPTTAMAQQCAAEEGGASKTLNPNVARVLQVVYEQMQAEQFQGALAGLNGLISSRGDSMAPFDKATTYELRGSVKASLDDYRGAQSDFRTALNTNALPANRNNQLRYFIAQIDAQLENYDAAITGLNQWISNARACGETVDSNAYYLLAAMYMQKQPPNPRAAVGPAENALAGSTEPKKGYYDLLNLIYSELNDNAKRGPLLETMVGYWPGNKDYWKQLSGAYSQAGRDRDAFSVFEVAYRAGLLETESEIVTLVNYYSFFENPYRGAKLLEQEMNAGNVARTQKNLVLLSQLWSQSREHKKSIPILREAARGSANGELSYRLGQVLLADEQYSAAQTALESALNKGGMDRKDTGDAWLLLGTARFSQAGPEDVTIWQNSRAAFRNAQRYEGARTRATDWITYINAVEQTYIQGKEIERAQIQERCEADLARIEQQERIEELQGSPVSAQTQQERAAKRAECAELLGTGDDDAAADDSGGGDGE